VNRRDFLKWVGLGAVERALPAPVKGALYSLAGSGRRARRISSTEEFRVRVYFTFDLHKPL
jgi:hypothetical protein